MSSAFRRKGAPVRASTGGNPGAKTSSPSLLGFKGVKAWTGGIHLTSTGLNDLDVIIGGGQPLGTCLLLQEDRWSRDLALSLVKYWVAESFSQDQKLLIPIEGDSSDDVDSVDFMDNPAESSSLFANRHEVVDLLSSLPRNLHWDKQKEKDRNSLVTNPPTGGLESLSILEEGDAESGDEDEGLKVAWQYKMSVQRERLGFNKKQGGGSMSNSSSNVFCHSYNLSGRMQDQREVSIDSCVIELQGVEYRSLTHAKTGGIKLFKQLLVEIQKTESSGKAIRLLFFHTDLSLLTATLPLLLVHIRKHALPVVVLICCRPTSDRKCWVAASKVADVVMSTEGFVSRKEYPPPPEFQHLEGLLTLSKVATVTASTANGGGHFTDLTTSKRPAAYIYGFKRDKRKLHIPLLHIPPEDYSEGGSSVGSGVRSGAGNKPIESRTSTGMGCASNTAGSPLDF